MANDPDADRCAAAVVVDGEWPFATTLTGFEWIGRVPGLAFGYKETIGYYVDPAAVPDKDGISALLRVLQLAAGLAVEGRTLADRLDDIGRTYGVHETSQLSFRVADLGLITAAMARLRAAPPAQLLEAAVEVVDLTPGHDHLPPSDAVMIINDMIKVEVRPSGTEPKLKCYLEVRRLRCRRRWRQGRGTAVHGPAAPGDGRPAGSLMARPERPLA